MVYFEGLGSGFMFEGVDALQWITGGQNWCQMRPDGGLEGPKWGLNVPRWRPGGGQMLPPGPHRSTSAKSMPRGVPETPGPARVRFCVQFWGPKGAKGAEIVPKSGPKVILKRPSFQITLRDRFLSIWRSEKHHFRDMKRTPSTFQSNKADM